MVPVAVNEVTTLMRCGCSGGAGGGVDGFAGGGVGGRAPIDVRGDVDGGEGGFGDGGLGEGGEGELVKRRLRMDREWCVEGDGLWVWEVVG